MIKTKADIPPPPPRTKGGSRKVAYAVSLPKLEKTPQNLQKEDLQDLNFKVSPDFHRAFKMAATA